MTRILRHVDVTSHVVKQSFIHIHLQGSEMIQSREWYVNEYIHSASQTRRPCTVVLTPVDNNVQFSIVSP